MINIKANSNGVDDIDVKVEKRHFFKSTSICRSNEYNNSSY